MSDTDGEVQVIEEVGFRWDLLQVGDVVTGVIGGAQVTHTVTHGDCGSVVWSVTAKRLILSPPEGVETP